MYTIQRRIFLYHHQILTVPDNSDNYPPVRVVTEAWELLTQVTRPNWETALFQLVDLSVQDTGMPVQALPTARQQAIYYQDNYLWRIDVFPMPPHQLSAYP